MDQTNQPSWDHLKESHKALSAAAAEHYDELYEHANFATGSYMRYEIERIRRFMPQAPSRKIAVDLGCGTGRDSFILSKQFDQVYAYDFSPEMVTVADRKKIHGRLGNVLFEVKDVEIEAIPLRDESVAFINTGFGMGSFVKEPERLFREIRRLLEPGGYVIFSFYNSMALVNQLELDWRPALAARVGKVTDTLDVDFEGKSYSIPARAYSLKEIEAKAKGYFKLIELTTFPSLSALFPQAMFQQEKARLLCSKVDELLAPLTDIAAGPYIVCVARKGGQPGGEERITGYRRVLDLLKLHHVPESIVEHGPVRTMDDVVRVLNAPLSQMAKTVLIAASGADEPDPDRLDAELYLFAIPADRKLDLGKVSKVINKPRPILRFATHLEVEALTGFRVGSIPPFGHPRNVPVVLDEPLTHFEAIWCGTGKATESLRISLADLKRLSAYSVADVSKPVVPHG